MGQPRRRAWNDGKTAHVRLCRCRRCEGGRHKPGLSVIQGSISGEKSPAPASTGRGNARPLQGGIETMDGIREDLFWAKVDRHGPSGCWLWLAADNGAGYGMFYVRSSGIRRGILAHRLAYELLVGPIPDGLQLDHLCRNTICVNPAHLEPVTPRENCRRGVSPTAINGRKTLCVHGHEFTPENTYVYPNGRRRCRACSKNDDHKRRRAS